ncbi:MAG: hypothetical protein U0441_11550 [Polyangiaceae bacterium]
MGVVARGARRWVSVAGARRVLAIGFLASFVMSFALAGFQIVFCRSMQQAQLACCCHAADPSPGDPAADQDPSPEMKRSPCCETRHFEKATSSSNAPNDSAPAIEAPAVAVLPVSVPVVAAFVPRVFWFVEEDRELPQGRAPPPPTIHLQTVRMLC